MSTFTNRPIQGVGIGLRTPHFKTILSEKPDIPWFEAMSENYFVDGSLAQYHLEQLRQDYPIALHGVSLSIGSAQGVKPDYLTRLKFLVDKFEPEWVSDHLSWCHSGEFHIADLLPLALTKESLAIVAANVQQVQDLLQRPIMLENISSYLEFKTDEMLPWEFMTQLAKQTGSAILLDVNNVYVSSVNQGYKANDFIEGIDTDLVKQFHLGGFEDKQSHLLDTHGAKVCDAVWQLYALALQRFGNIPTLIERDTHIPPFEEMMQEANRAQEIIDGIFEKATG